MSVRLLVLGYLGFIIYGSLYPFSDWRAPATPLFHFLHFNSNEPLDKADVLQNVLVYMPLGMLMVLWFKDKIRYFPALLCATLFGTGLSLVVESIQQYLPSRVSSLSDLAMNALGTFIGGILAAFLTRETVSGARIGRLRDAWFRAGPLPDIGLIAIALWVLSQTSPLVPSLDVGHLRQGLALLKRSIAEFPNLNLAQTCIYALYIEGLALLAVTLKAPGRKIGLLYLLLVGAVLLCKVLVVGRQLSLEAMIGAVTAASLLPCLRMSNFKAAFCGMGMVAAGFSLQELTSVDGAATHAFNYIPFTGQMASLSGLENILEVFWPFWAIAYFARYLTPLYRRDEVAWFGGGALIVALFLLEWHQQILPGRFGDITQVLIGVLGWTIPWFIGESDYVDPRRNAASDTRYFSTTS
jgi:VanZ family protein